MSNSSQRFWPETVRFLTHAQITAGAGSYVPIGQAVASSSNNQYAFLHQIRLFDIEDTTDVMLTFSFDGINDHFVMVNNAFRVYDICTNRSDMGEILEIPEGTIIYVKGAPTTGNVYLSVYYAK